MEKEADCAVCVRSRRAVLGGHRSWTPNSRQRSEVLLLSQ